MPQKTANIKDEIEVEKSFYSNEQDGGKLAYFQNGNGLKNYYEEAENTISDIIENASPKFAELKKRSSSPSPPPPPPPQTYQNGDATTAESPTPPSSDSDSESGGGTIMKYVFQNANGKVIALGDTEHIPSGYELVKTLRLIIDERKVVVTWRKESAASQVWQEMQDDEQVEYVARGPDGDEIRIRDNSALPAQYRVLKTVLTRRIRGEATTPQDLQDETVWELLDPAEWEEAKEREVIKYTATKAGESVTLENVAKIPEGYELTKTTKVKTFIAEITNGDELLAQDEIVKYLYKDLSGDLVVLESNVNVCSDYEFVSSVVIKTMLNEADWEEYGNECEALQYVIKDQSGREIVVDSLDYLLPGCKLSKVLKMKTIIGESANPDVVDQQIAKRLVNPERWKEMKHCEIVKYIVKDEAGKPSSLNAVENLPRGFEVTKILKLKTFVKELDENEMKADRRVKYVFENPRDQDVLILDQMNPPPAGYVLAKIVQLKVDEEELSQNERVEYVFKNRGGAVLTRNTALDPPAGYELIKIVRSKANVNGHG